MYQGLNLKLSANNIIVISPNSLFSKYISNVLPDLGEENINEYTFENIFLKLFENKLSMKTKSENYENIIIAETEEKRNFLRAYDEFKGSIIFIKIIDRFIDYYEHKLIPFEDVYYNGQIIEKRELLKAFLLSGKLNMPAAKKLKIIEGRIMEKVRDMRNIRRSKIENAVNKLNNHEFEIKSFTRVLAAKETQSLINKLRKFTEFETFEIYKKLFSDINIFKKISNGLNLPENIDDIISYTNSALNDPFNIPYSDGIALMYMKLKAEGCDLFSGIKQVVVDEVQDYYPMHYHILKILYPYARFTIVGDINQSIEKSSDISLYDEIISIFNFEKSNKIFLNKSYRSSYEINIFSTKLLDSENETEFFKRNEEEPIINKASSSSNLQDEIVKTIEKYKSQGFSSIAVICKNRKEASELYFKLSSSIKIKLIDYLDYDSVLEGTLILPVYLAKGLEFDAVIVYEANDKKYNTEYDKKLLYIACTRALHRLSLFYTGKISRFLK
jgi:DNA helicase-2/ATP-dependent DNA helicase PcrA